VTNDGTNLYDLAQPRLERALATIVSPPFRIKQIEEWMYVHGVDAFDAMTNLPKELRAALAEHYTLAFPRVVERTTPAADGSQKYLFSLADGNRIEAVYMPMGDRTSVCLSSQAGCAVGCTFCVTGFFGAGRNLTPGEMLGQFFTIQHEHAVPMELMNVVFMGMGEPLLNWDAVDPTLTILNQPDGFGIGARHITVSTVGIIPAMQHLAARPEQFRLAISLHSPNSVSRLAIMPIEKRYKLADVLRAAKAFKRRITFEYVLIDGVNDRDEDVAELAKLARDSAALVNLLPLHPGGGDPALKPSPRRRQHGFVEKLKRKGVEAVLRRSRGLDIDAACGQLRVASERDALEVAPQSHGDVYHAGRLDRGPDPAKA